jgi:hypothetical protein
MGREAGSADNERAVKAASPPTEGRAVSRLLVHCARVKGVTEPPVRARDQLEDAVGGELAQRLVDALAGDHAIPARHL